MIEQLISKLKNFQSLWIYSIILMELLNLQRRKRQIHRIKIDCYYLLFISNKYIQFIQKFIELGKLNDRKENSVENGNDQKNLDYRVNPKITILKDL